MIRRVGGAKGEATVQFTTTAGNALSGNDYYDVDETITFKDGEAAKTVFVHVIKDDISDGGETVNLKLKDPTGADLAVPVFVTLYIY